MYTYTCTHTCTLTCFWWVTGSNCSEPRGYQHYHQYPGQREQLPHPSCSSLYFWSWKHLPKGNGGLCVFPCVSDAWNPENRHERGTCGANAPPHRQKGCFGCAPFMWTRKQHLYRWEGTIYMDQEKCGAAALALVGFWSICGHSPTPYSWPIHPNSMYYTFLRIESFVWSKKITRWGGAVYSQPY